LSFGYVTDEDVYAYKVSEDYANFLHQIPWYEYPYWQKLRGLWTETSLFGHGIFRKWERKFILSVEYSVKALYAAFIKMGTKAAFVPAPTSIMLVTQTIPSEVLLKEPRINVVQTIDAKQVLIEVPRYEEFTEVLLFLARNNINFTEIASNNDILLTIIAPAEWTFNRSDSTKLFEQVILTERSKKRIGLRVSVEALKTIVNELEQQGIVVEHFYDY
jgi:hypothetical protein